MNHSWSINQKRGFPVTGTCYKKQTSGEQRSGKVSQAQEERVKGENGRQRRLQKRVGRWEAEAIRSDQSSRDTYMDGRKESQWHGQKVRLFQGGSKPFRFLSLSWAAHQGQSCRTRGTQWCGESVVQRTAAERCPRPDPWNLWPCHILWQKDSANITKVVFTIKRLPWIISVTHSNHMSPKAGKFPSWSQTDVGRRGSQTLQRKEGFNVLLVAMRHKGQRKEWKRRLQKLKMLAPHWQQSRKHGPWSCNHRELDSAWTRKQIPPRASREKAGQPTPWTSDLQKREIIKYVLFKSLSLS